MGLWNFYILSWLSDLIFEYSEKYKKEDVEYVGK